MTEIPPAVPVSELLEYLRRSFVLASGESGCLTELLVTRHRLQPFSTDYFAPDGPLFTFDAGLREAVAACSEGRTAPQPFLAAPLPAPEPGLLAISDLLRCFANPARFFLERRLGGETGEQGRPAERQERLPKQKPHSASSAGASSALS